jgi:predicted RNase H-like HicB family nuclease
MKSRLPKKPFQQYTAVFELDKKVGGYTVTIPALPGCISEGDTFESALENIQEAAELYLEVTKPKAKKRIARDQVFTAPIRVAA